MYYKMGLAVVMTVIQMVYINIFIISIVSNIFMFSNIATVNFLSEAR